MRNWSALPYYRWLVFAVTAIGTFMATLDSSIVNVAMPAITETLHAGLGSAQWVVTAYLLTISSLLPLFGRAGDMYGRRLIYSLGFLVFTVGSAFCGGANSLAMLIAARVAQAVGAAMLMANSSAIIMLHFPGGGRGRALGMVGTMVALGSMTGPALGGLLVHAFGWESVFYVNIPIGLAGFVLARMLLPPEPKRHLETFDWLGAILFTTGMASLLFSLSFGHSWGWGSVKTLGSFFASVIAFILFIRQEKRVEHPMLDLALFRQLPFLFGNLSGMFSFMAIFSNTFLLPFYLSNILGANPGQIGLLLTPFPLVLAIVAPVSGYLSERVNQSLLTSAGLFVTSVALWLLAGLTEHSALWQAAVCQAILGLGNGMFQSPNNNSVMSSVPREKVGIAGGISALVRNIGMVTGVAVAVSVFEYKQQVLLGMEQPSPAQITAAFLDGYHTALLVGVGFASIGMVLSFNRNRFTSRPES